MNQETHKDLALVILSSANSLVYANQPEHTTFPSVESFFFCGDLPWKATRASQQVFSRQVQAFGELHRQIWQHRMDFDDGLVDLQSHHVNKIRNQEYIFPNSQFVPE